MTFCGDKNCALLLYGGSSGAFCQQIVEIKATSPAKVRLYRWEAFPLHPGQPVTVGRPTNIDQLSRSCLRMLLL
jgi:hypothetical protein